VDGGAVRCGARACQSTARGVQERIDKGFGAVSEARQHYLNNTSAYSDRVIREMLAVLDGKLEANARRDRT
jgi:hypothetical protein